MTTGVMKQQQTIPCRFEDDTATVVLEVNEDTLQQLRAICFVAPAVAGRLSVLFQVVARGVIVAGSDLAPAKTQKAKVSKYPTIKYLPKTIITILTLDTWN